jgi:hypothetical protein
MALAETMSDDLQRLDGQAHLKARAVLIAWDPNLVAFTPRGRSHAARGLDCVRWAVMQAVGSPRGMYFEPCDSIAISSKWCGFKIARSSAGPARRERADRSFPQSSQPKTILP